MTPILTATLLSFLLTLVTSKSVQEIYKPTDEQLKIIFPEEYEKIQKTSKLKTELKKCAGGEKCTLKDIYEIFNTSPAVVTPETKLNGTDDRTALVGDECPSGYVKFGGKCAAKD